MYKHHLAGGVAKGAFSEEEAEKKFNAWLDEKAAKVNAKKDSLSKASADAKAKALEAEKAVNEARIAAATPEVEEIVEEVVEEVVVEEVVSNEEE
jgi:small subunit ribosomal protein S16